MKPWLWLALVAAGAAPACAPARPGAGQTGAAQSAVADRGPKARGRAQVGQTYYARLFLVQLLNEPVEGARVMTMVNRNDELVVSGVVNARWLHVVYTNGDVAVQGYVRRDWLAERPVVVPRAQP